MPYDAFSRLMKPDYGGMPETPQWQDMGESPSAPDMSPFTDALRARMKKKNTGPFGQGDPGGEMPFSQMLGGIGGGGGEGGPKSL